MITEEQQAWINARAYLPEHIVSYVTAISRSEPFLLEDFLIFVKKNHLVFIGYPLKETFRENEMEKFLDKAIRRFKPETVSLMAPSVPASYQHSSPSSPDHYFRLDVSSLVVPQKTRNMIRRAMRGLRVQRAGALRTDHLQLIEEFLKVHPLDEAARSIYQGIPDYVSSVSTACVLEARNEAGELAAFDIAEFGAADYAMYMFNVSLPSRSIPGASDLLFSEILNHARTERKRYVNMGLGIHPGVSFFKTKWGGVPFLPYRFCLFSPSASRGIDDLYQKL